MSSSSVTPNAAKSPASQSTSSTRSTWAQDGNSIDPRALTDDSDPQALAFPGILIPSYSSPTEQSEYLSPADLAYTYDPSRQSSLANTFNAAVADGPVTSEAYMQWTSPESELTQTTSPSQTDGSGAVLSPEAGQQAQEQESVASPAPTASRATVESNHRNVAGQDYQYQTQHGSPQLLPAGLKTDAKQPLATYANSAGSQKDGTSQSPSTASPTTEFTSGGDSKVPADVSFRARHNIIERRYRENLNTQIESLRKSMIALSRQEDTAYTAQGLRHLTKAAVIAAATDEIKRTEADNQRLLEENERMLAQIQELERHVLCGACPLMQLMSDMNLANGEQQPS